MEEKEILNLEALPDGVVVGPLTIGTLKELKRVWAERTLPCPCEDPGEDPSEMETVLDWPDIDLTKQNQRKIVFDGRTTRATWDFRGVDLSDVAPGTFYTILSIHTGKQWFRREHVTVTLKHKGDDSWLLQVGYGVGVKGGGTNWVHVRRLQNMEVGLLYTGELILGDFDDDGPGLLLNGDFGEVDLPFLWWDDWVGERILQISHEDKGGGGNEEGDEPFPSGTGHVLVEMEGEKGTKPAPPVDPLTHDEIHEIISDRVNASNRRGRGGPSGAPNLTCSATFVEALKYWDPANPDHLIHFTDRSERTRRYWREVAEARDVCNVDWNDKVAQRWEEDIERLYGDVEITKPAIFGGYVVREEQSAAARGSWESLPDRFKAPYTLRSLKAAAGKGAGGRNGEDTLWEIVKHAKDLLAYDLDQTLATGREPTTMLWRWLKKKRVV
jgi:hypothetical protein